MNACFFSPDLALPPGYREFLVQPRVAELALERLASAAERIGGRRARELARRLGRYELRDEQARELRLRGVELGEGGEIRALSPGRWPELPAAEALEELLARARSAGLEPAGIRLAAAEARALARVLRLARGAPTAEQVIRVACHVFENPLRIVMRHTEPRLPGP